jgi:Predicted acyltransferases
MAHWEWSLFISGVLLAGLGEKSSPEPAPIPMLPLTSRVDDEEEGLDEDSWTENLKSCKMKFPKPASPIVDSFLFLFALYLGSAPSGNPDSLAAAPGYGWLSPWIPRSWGLFMGYFYPEIGAILLVSVLAQSEFLQRIFTTKVAQYLGDISLSLYMLHILILHTLGNWLIVQCSATMRLWGSWSYTIGISSKFIYSAPSRRCPSRN